MKNNKGKQVFSGDTDDILAEKIIKHSETNSTKEDSSGSEPEKSGPSCCESLSAKQCITVVIGVFSLLFLLFMIFNGIIITGKKQ